MDGCPLPPLRGGNPSTTSLDDAARSISDGQRDSACGPHDPWIHSRKEGLSFHEVETAETVRPSRISGLTHDMRGPARWLREACVPLATWPSIFFSYRIRNTIGAFLVAAMGGAAPSFPRAGSARILPWSKNYLRRARMGWIVALDTRKEPETIGLEGAIQQPRFCRAWPPTSSHRRGFLIALDTARCILGEPNPQESKIPILHPIRFYLSNNR